MASITGSSFLRNSFVNCSTDRIHGRSSLFNCSTVPQVRVRSWDDNLGRETLTETAGNSARRLQVQRNPPASDSN